MSFDDEDYTEKKYGLAQVRAEIKEGKLDLAISYLSNCVVAAATFDPEADLSLLYYLLGNAYMKLGDFPQAMDFYNRAIDINPESPATEARKMLQGILGFYNRDMYNH